MFAEIALHNLRMKEGDYTYIWQATDWPNWRFDHASLAQSMVDVSRAQGMLIGRLADVGLALRDQASLLALTEDATGNLCVYPTDYLMSTTMTTS